MYVCTLQGIMEVIDLSSSEDEGIVDLCSDDKDIAHMFSDSEEDHNYHGRGNRFHQQPLHYLGSMTSSDSSSGEEPIMLDSEGFISVRQASSYSPAQNILATENMSKLRRKGLPRLPVPSMTSVIDFEAVISEKTQTRTILVLARKLDTKKPFSQEKGKKICQKEFCQFRSLSIRVLKAQPKKKTRGSSPTSTLRPTSRPAAGTLVLCPASVLKQTRDPTDLADYDVVVTTYTIVALEVA
ncbi:hypothetical protein HU200_064265 [Digitaria exilis]|uniref:Uncharacterized protein n=1 Tax=Digitaria exilis TaxID=1010633 RepID=A0A835A601_9POAL|nr:hypothetical protein HU200_064265 [Digitaria exilis]